MAYLHGVETIEVTDGVRTVREVKSAVVLLVGTAPSGPNEELTLVLNPDGAAQFGAELPGFTIPKALNAIQAQRAGTVVVVNVYDPAKHNTQEVETKTPNTAGKFRLSHPPMSGLVMKNQANETLVEGDHYTINAFGDVSLTPDAINGVVGEDGTSTFSITGGTVGVGNEITDVVVDGSSLISSPVAFTNNAADTATALAAAITLANVDGFTATASGDTVTLIYPNSDAKNGLTPVVTVGGDVTASNPTAIAGGVTPFAATTSVSATYDHFDASKVQASDIIGSIDPVTNERTGLKLARLCFNTFGFKPKNIICPGYSSLSAVSAEMGVQADDLDAMYYIDAPVGMTPQQVITARGPLSGSNLNTSSERAVICYPHLMAFDAYSNADELRPLSQFLVGVQSATDATSPYSYAESPSNKEIRGVTGVETLLSWALNDPNTEANMLNEVGVVCVISGFGTGLRVWGNRSAAWPTETHPRNFISVRRTADIIHESVELAMMPFIDKPINDAIIDSIRQTVNGYMRTLEQLGRLLPGSECIYDPADNPPTEIANGHITFRLVFMPPTPAERITFLSTIDINLLANVA